jgi:hypothetical protein
MSNVHSDMFSYMYIRNWCEGFMYKLKKDDSSLHNIEHGTEKYK